MFKNHLEMIGRNETSSKKAKFWQSFVRSLKGSDDIRAGDHYKPRGIFRPISDLPEFSSTWPYGRSIYDDPLAPAERITGAGYRYDPLHRDIYGYSPRNIYPHNYPSTLDRYRPAYHITKSKPYDADAAWREHLERVARRNPERFGSIFSSTYPFSRYPLYLVHSKRPTPPAEFDPHRSWLDWLDRMNELDRLFPTVFPSGRLSPTPTKIGAFSPRPSEVAYNYAGQPIYGGYRPSKIWDRLLHPSPYLPLSSLIRDPWWWDLPSLRPYSPYLRRPYPFYLRDSYLSPVKRTYLWDKHPLRPFAAVY